MKKILTKKQVENKIRELRVKSLAEYAAMPRPPKAPSFKGDVPDSLKELRLKKSAACEILGEAYPAEHFTFRRGKWIFVSTEAPEDMNEYHLEISSFFKSPMSTIDWIAHLSTKPWFDASDFCQMIHRFREATDSFWGIK